MDKVILLDNGHGEDTEGKRSPDWSLMEWSYTREIVRRIYKKLIDKGYNAHILVPEDHDVGLSERCKRANQLSEGKEAILISIHCNAAGCDGKWHNARGWQVHTCLTPSPETIELANTLYNEVNELGLKTRRPCPSQNYWKNDFYILKKTKCPAVLTENFFQDNKEDVEFLLSSEGKEAVVRLHINAIMKLLK